MVEVMTIVIGAIKFLAIVGFIIVAVNFGITINTRIKDASMADDDYNVFNILWGQKIKFFALLGILFFLIFIFNMEAAYRPKATPKASIVETQMMDTEAELPEFKPEVKPDYQKNLDDNRKSNEAAKEAFNKLE